MSRRQIFLLYYYSQLPIVITAVVLTGTINAVLYQAVNLNVITLVGLATFLTYSIDNLIDWHRDASHYAHITRFVKIYHKLTYVFIPLSAAGIIYLTCKSSNDLQIGILLLGAAAVMGTTRLPNQWRNPATSEKSVQQFIINRLFVSTIWTIVCVFLPIWYSDSIMTPRTGTIFLYLFCLVFIYAILWKFEKSAYALKRKLLDSGLFRVLAIFAGAASLLVIFDILSGLAPVYNLVNLLPPIVNLVFIQRVTQKPVFLRRKISRFTAALILLCSLSAAIYIFSA